MYFVSTCVRNIEMFKKSKVLNAVMLTAQVQAPTETAEEPIAVDVAEEEVDNGVAPAGEITIREHVDR